MQRGSGDRHRRIRCENLASRKGGSGGRAGAQAIRSTTATGPSKIPASRSANGSARWPSVRGNSWGQALTSPGTTPLQRATAIMRPSSSFWVPSSKPEPPAAILVSRRSGWPDQEDSLRPLECRRRIFGALPSFVGLHGQDIRQGRQYHHVRRFDRHHRPGAASNRDALRTRQGLAGHSTHDAAGHPAPDRAAG